MFKLSILLLSIAFTLTFAQDPAPGWMAYAVGEVPAGTQRITRMEAKWKVSNNPPSSNAFFSPWFGMDPDDNLNLIQPVNPWLGSAPWAYYTEYFQWSPEYNSNSRQRNVLAGQTLHGYMIYDYSTDSYNLTQSVVETGRTSEQIVKCQNGKRFRVPYFVYEKLWSCGSYPSDQVVTFTDIKVECDGKDCTNDVKWSAEVKDANCDMKAHILSQTTIAITWNVNAVSKYDNHSPAELFDLNYHGWARNFPLKRPTE
eukprot:TRINITY_DN13075_c0_g1_i1.p1 TRINITY_DN13075_c0_g1~~TRINITY_DN13075_c0_g1_i1.p1  ORF type:complete len:265 (+),score=48.82 TRINITY_DN13075_c0_g1_i1:28-795(+)